MVGSRLRANVDLSCVTEGPSRAEDCHPTPHTEPLSYSTVALRRPAQLLVVARVPAIPKYLSFLQ